LAEIVQVLVTGR